MVDFISTLGLQLINSNNLTSSQVSLSKLSEQLTTGKYSLNLSDYSSSRAQRLMNFNGKMNEQSGFLDVIESLSPRIELYDTSLEGLESTASSAFSAIISANTYNPTTNTSLQELIKGYMSQAAYYLNQKLGDRYIFSGSRYDQEPVKDLTTLPVPPTEPAPYTISPNQVPIYDTSYDPLDPTATFPEAHVRDSVSIDTTEKLTYGLNSNQTGFQQLIMGLRYAYSATQDQVNFSSYMDTARSLISQGLDNIRADHTNLTNANTNLIRTRDLIDKNISNLKDQVADIQNVDVNEVAVKMTTLQAQLETSYAATGKIVGLSIIDYL